MTETSLTGPPSTNVSVDQGGAFAIEPGNPCDTVTIDLSAVAPTTPENLVLFLIPDIDFKPAKGGVRGWMLSDFKGQTAVKLTIHEPWEVVAGPAGSKMFELKSTRAVGSPLISLFTRALTDNVALAIDPDPGTGFPPRR